MSSRELDGVLLLEDDADDALFVRENLAEQFSVTQVGTLAAALERLRTEAPVCLLADLELPDAEGVEIITALHAVNPAIPVVVLTSRASEDEAALAAIRAGADDYLPKRLLSSEMLVRVVRSSIERRRVASELHSSRQLLEGAFAASPIAKVIADLNGTIVLTNPALGQLVGRPERDLVDVHLDELFPAHERAEMAGVLRRVATDEATTLRAETRCHHVDGTRIPVILDVSLVRDSEQRPIHLLVQLQDITERKAAESTQAQLAAIVQNSPDAMFLIDMDGTVRTWNAAAVGQYGWTAEEIVGRGVDLLVPEEQLVELRETMAELALGRITLPYATRRLTKDGAVIDVSVCLCPITDDAGTVTAGSFIARDITRQKADDRALRESEDRYRRMIETATEGIWLVDTSGVITFANTRIAELLASTTDDLLGVSMLDFVHPADRHRALRCLEPREATATATEELRLLRPDGTRFWALVSTSGQTDARGARTGTLTMVTDISERKAAESDLVERERRFRAVFDNALDAMLVMDEDRHYIDANPAACTLFGIGRAALLKLRLDDVVEADELTSMWWGLRESGPTGGATTLRRPADGQPRDVEFATKDNIVPGSHLLVLRDVTERAHGEQERLGLEVRLNQAQRMETVGQFAGGIAHDFNNLLAVILNYAQFAEAGVELAAVRADVAEIRTAAERARDLTHQLLVFSRRDLPRTEVFDVSRLVADTHRLLGRVLGAGIDSHLDVPGSPVWIDADPGQVDQVLMNLAVNARDAMPDGGVLSMSATTANGEARHPGWVDLVVADTGVGMAKDVADRAFEPFYSTKPKGSGTGLGLSMVYGIVTNLTGSIDIDSRIGEGTTITIRLPLAAPDAAPKRPPEPAERNGASGGDRRVLVVEDEEAVRRLTVRILERAGYAVTAVAGAAAALELLEAAATDLLVTDVVMPGMSGIELTRRLAAIRPGLPTVVMSGFSDRVGQVPAGTEILRKPFTAETLLDALDRAWLRSPDAGAVAPRFVPDGAVATTVGTEAQASPGGHPSAA